MTEADTAGISRNPAGELSMLDFLLLILRRRRTVFGIPAVLALLVVAVGLSRPRQWSAKAAFYPQTTGSALGRLGGLAAQFGVNVPGSGDSPDQSPDFYVGLILSDQLLRSVAQSTFTMHSRDGTRTGPLVQLYDIDAGSPGLDLAAAVKRLQDDVSARTDIKTGVVGLTVRSPDPALSVDLVDRILALVNQFNVESRQTRASAEREFTGHRLDEMRADLRRAEQDLQNFLVRNRTFKDSPQLQFENDRLKREVDLRAQLYGTLSQSYEQARIDEVRNTAVITVVEKPFLAARPDSRGLLVKGLLVMVAGLILATLTVLAQESGRATEREAPATAAEMRALILETKADLRHPWDRLLRPAVRWCAEWWRSRRSASRG